MPSKHPIPMLCFATGILISTVAIAQMPSQAPSAANTPHPATQTTASGSLPPSPGGRSTVMGGEIRTVDPVRDQFILKVSGGQSVKIYFDERTQVYRNGTKIHVLDLHPSDHASVETTLDGTAIFALRIHILSKVPGDELRGRIVSYNSRRGELTLMANSSHEPLTLHLPPDAPVATIGQDGSSKQLQGPASFIPGSVVDVRYTGSKSGRGIVTGVDILAIPGSTFVFSGTLSSMDLHIGRLIVLDPRDNKTYPIEFPPTLLPVMRTLHAGSIVKVVTLFDGTHYVASQITAQ